MRLFFKNIIFFILFIFAVSCISLKDKSFIDKTEKSVLNISELEFHKQSQFFVKELLNKNIQEFLKLLKREMSEISVKKILVYEKEINGYIEKIDLLKYYKQIKIQTLAAGKIEITYSFHQDWLKQEILNYFENLPDPLTLPDLYLDFETTNNPYFKQMVYRQSDTDEIIDIKTLESGKYSFKLANLANFSETIHSEQEFICLE